MIDPFQQLSDADLGTLATALKVGRLIPPYTEVGVRRIVSADMATSVASRLSELGQQGMRPEHAALVLETIAATRATRPIPEDLVELVWTGPIVAGIESRDTAVVVRELFAQAAQEIIVVGYAVFQGRDVFRGLAERMVPSTGLDVRLFLDIHRTYQDTSSEAQIVQQFVRKFVEQDWPDGFPLPRIYYDPRSLSIDSTKRASLHAKCVIVDRRVAFVSSANFTEAAQERNIEAGVVVRATRFAAQLADHFGALADSGRLVRLKLPAISTRSGD